MSEDLTRNSLHACYHLEMTNLQCERAISIPNQPFKSHSAWFRPLAHPLNSTESSALLGLRQLMKLGYRLAKFVFIDSHHQDRVQHLPEQNPARSQEATSLKMWNSTRWVEFTDPEMLGREEGQLCNPAFYRFFFSFHTEYSHLLYQSGLKLFFHWVCY